MVSEARDINEVDDLLDDSGVRYEGLVQRVRLQREGRTLAAVAFAAERLMAATCWLDVADEVLTRLGRATDVSRVHVFENHDDGGRLRTEQRCEWVAAGVALGPVVDDPIGPTYQESGFGRWVEVLSAGGSIQGRTSDQPSGERAALEAQGIRAILVVPIFAGHEWWGFVGFDRCEEDGDWSGAETDALKAAAGILGSAVQRERSEASRRESEERFRKLVELAPDGIVVHRQGEVVFANPAAARLVGGRDPQELVGRPVLDFVHKDSRPMVLARLQRLREGRPVPLVEETFVKVDGTPFFVEVAASPFVYEGEPAVQVVIRDVSDRRRTEREIEQQNAFLAALHETTLGLMNRLDLDDLLHAITGRAGALVGTPDVYLYLVDDHGDGLEVRVGHGRFADWIGYRLGKGEGVAGKVWETGQPLVISDYDAWPGRSSAFPSGVFRSVLGLPLGSEVRGIIGVLGVTFAEPGREFDRREIELLERFGELASIALDNARLYLGSQTELAERRATEHQLQEAEAKYRTLVEQIPAIVYTAGVGDTGQWLYVSPQIESLLGYTPKEWKEMSRPFATHLHPDDRDRVFAEETQKTAVTEPLRSEYRLMRRDGSYVWILDEASLVVDQEGRALFWHGVMYDITYRKRSEDALRQALEREHEASEQLRALDQLRTTFLHAVSHELRTPLSAVLGFALTLEREDIQLSGADQRDPARRLAANARKLDQLLSDLLDLDRLDRGILEPRRRPTDVGALVRRTVEGSEVLGLRPVRVEADLVVASVDAPKVERIVENLLANAARHTPPRTAIWVRVLAEGNGVTIAVEDSGPGVPEELRQSIFEPFHQGPGRPEYAPGVGIGLSLVARFAELHGGRAWVQPREGGGASFRVHLPGAPEEDGDPAYFSTGTPTREPYSVQEPS